MANDLKESADKILFPKRRKNDFYDDYPKTQIQNQKIRCPCCNEIVIWAKLPTNADYRCQACKDLGRVY